MGFIMIDNGIYNDWFSKFDETSRMGFIKIDGSTVYILDSVYTMIRLIWNIMTSCRDLEWWWMDWDNDLPK